LRRSNSKRSAAPGSRLGAYEIRSTAVTDSGLPEFAWKVFGAFDAGEFLRPDAPEDQQGEVLTRTE